MFIYWELNQCLEIEKFGENKVISLFDILISWRSSMCIRTKEVGSRSISELMAFAHFNKWHEQGDGSDNMLKTKKFWMGYTILARYLKLSIKNTLLISIWCYVETVSLQMIAFVHDIPQDKAKNLLYFLPLEKLSNLKCCVWREK